MNRHLRHYHWKKVCRYGHAHDRFFALFLLSYLTRVRRAGLEPAFCASLFSSKSCCVFHKHETFFSAQVLPVKLPPYSVILVFLSSVPSSGFPFGILIHNSSMVSCIFSRSFSVIAFSPVIFFLPDSDFRVSHRKISSRRYPMSQKFFEMLLIFPTVFSPVEPSYLPRALPNGNFCIGLCCRGGRQTSLSENSGWGVG